MPTRQPQPPKTRARTRPKLQHQLFLVLGIVLLAGGAFYAALVVASRIETIFLPGSHVNLGVASNLPGVAGGDAQSGGAPFNILVLSLDETRASDGDNWGLTRSGGWLTNVAFVMRVDPSAGTVRGLAVPRDMYVDIPLANGKGTFKERINAAYEYGEINQPGSGPALAEKVYGQVLGLKIDHYIIIDFEGFRRVVDMLGGVDIDVPTPVNDPLYSDTELPGDYYPCKFNVGSHHMDGKDALCYARTRYNSSDLDRILRQQRIMYAVIDKAKQTGLLSNPSNMISLWKQYRSLVKTDVNDLLVPGYAKLAASIDLNHLAFLSLGPATTPYTTAEGHEVLLPSAAGIKQIVAAFLSDGRLDQEGAKVEIVNATGSEGEATKAADYLVGLGIPRSSVVIENGTTSDGKTAIVDFGGKRYTTQRLTDWLGLARDRAREATAQDASLRQSNGDIVVVLGADALFQTSPLASGQ